MQISIINSDDTFLIKRFPIYIQYFTLNYSFCIRFSF